MKLYLLTQIVNNDYDTHDSIVVCAENEEDACKIDPYGNKTQEEFERFGTWASLKDIKAKYIGEAGKGIERGVILASFNAG